jgi:hypothetical protein
MEQEEVISLWPFALVLFGVYLLLQLPEELCNSIAIVVVVILVWAAISGKKILEENTERMKQEEQEEQEAAARKRKRSRAAKKGVETRRRNAEKKKEAARLEEEQKNTPKVIESINNWPNIVENQFNLNNLHSVLYTYSEVSEYIEKRQGELSIIEKDAKANAFEKQNFQKGHSSPTIRQKEKKWQESRLILKIGNFGMIATDLSTIGCNICSNHICNSELTFWWRIFPEVELNLLCEECAIREDLVEEIPETEFSSRNIPRDVKDSVWNRDGGRCVECGSNKNLEFDHIIPHSKGGSNTYRNIQLLCESCNRSKSDKIG